MFWLLRVRGQGGLDHISSKSPFQLQPFCDFVRQVIICYAYPCSTSGIFQESWFFHFSVHSLFHRIARLLIMYARYGRGTLRCCRYIKQAILMHYNRQNKLHKSMLSQWCKEKIWGGKLHEAYERVLKSYIPVSSYNFPLVLTISIDKTMFPYSIQIYHFNAPNIKCYKTIWELCVCILPLLVSTCKMQIYTGKYSLTNLFKVMNKFECSKMLYI